MKKMLQNSIEEWSYELSILRETLNPNHWRYETNDLDREDILNHANYIENLIRQNKIRIKNI